MIMERNVFTRRSLVAGLGALGAAGICASAVRNAHAACVPDAWDEEADVVVVGFGGAGVAAACSAAEAGARVLVLEKMSEDLAGGDTSCNSGYVGPAQDVSTYIANSGYSMSEEQAQSLAADVDAACVWVRQTEGVTFPDGSPIVDGGAEALYAAIRNRAVDSGVRVIYETAAIELVQNPETGEVLGVLARRPDGSMLCVKAACGVVLASGDYGASQEIMGALHYPGLPNVSVCTPAATGDALVMGARAGAKIAHVDNLCIDWAGLALRKASEAIGTGVLYNYAGVGEGASNSASKLFVNYRGERFMNEEAVIAHMRSTASLPMLAVEGNTGDSHKGFVNLPAFMVMDQSCFEAEPLVGNTGTGWRIKKHIYEWSEDNVAELEMGWIMKADSLEDLAALMTVPDYASGEELAVPADALAATVTAYNEGCASGQDAYGRTNFQPLGDGPFYAVELVPCVMYTIGGLVGDADCRVLDWSDEPIPRLYRAGNVGHGTEYSPIGVSGCIGQGLHAGSSVAALTPQA